MGYLRKRVAAPSYAVDQVIFAHDPFAIADDVMQQVENLRLDVDRFGPTPQLLALDIQAIVFELIDQPSSPQTRLS